MGKKKKLIYFECPPNLINSKNILPDLYKTYPELLLCLEGINIGGTIYKTKSCFNISVSYSKVPISSVLIVKGEKDASNIIFNSVSSNKKTEYLVFKKTKKAEIDNYVKSILSSPDYLNLFLQNIKTSVYTSDKSDFCGMEIDFTYRFDNATCKRRKKEMEAKVKSIVKNAKKARLQDWKRAFSVIEYCVANWQYGTYRSGDLHHTAYSAIVHNKAVCMGFSLAVCLIFKELGIPCKYITGILDGERHGWNMVYINGGWFFIDVTSCISTKDPFYGWGITKFKDGRIIETSIKEKLAYKCPNSFKDKIKH